MIGTADVGRTVRVDVEPVDAGQTEVEHDEVRHDRAEERRASSPDRAVDTRYPASAR